MSVEMNGDLPSGCGLIGEGDGSVSKFGGSWFSGRFLKREVGRLRENQ